MRPGHPEKRERLARRGDIYRETLDGHCYESPWPAFAHKIRFLLRCEIFCRGDRASCMAAAIAWIEVSGA